MREIDLGRETPGEKCGIIGVIGTDFDAARIAHPGLFALQHRGQQSSGISVTDGEHLKTHKGMGLMIHVYDEKTIEGLPGFAAIGHNRYGTSGASTIEHAQPVEIDNELAVAHNGNLPSTKPLEEFLNGKNFKTERRNDSEMMADAIRYFMTRGAKLEEAVTEAYPLFTGAFSLVILSKDKLIAVRDPRGIRPLSLGKLNSGYVFASETCALDTVGAKHISDVLPGELVVVENEHLTRHQITKGQQALDIFCFVYFARPDSILLGKRVYEVRKNFGKRLYEEDPMDADVVIPVPDSAEPAALGYAQASGIPFGDGFIKNRYIHRTFIDPEQHMREKGVALKLNTISETVRDKRVIMIDDSIVRGTTAGPIVKLLYKAGAKEVHVKISSPPVLYSDYYGIDIKVQNELIAARMHLNEIREHIGATSLQYLSYRGLIEATGLPEDVFSTSCFTGIYPIDLRERAKEVSKIIFQY